MNVLEYILYGDPVPMPRPVVGKYGRIGVSKRALEAKARHAEAVALAMPEGWPRDARYELEVRAYRGTARRCDGDNLLKLVLDAINKHAFNDDEQVDEMRITKAIDRDEPRTEVRLIVRAALESPVLRGGAT